MFSGFDFVETEIARPALMGPFVLKTAILIRLCRFTRDKRVVRMLTPSNDLLYSLRPIQVKFVISHWPQFYCRLNTHSQQKTIKPYKKTGKFDHLTDFY